MAQVGAALSMETPATMPPEQPPWPSQFASPQQILDWLNKLQAKDGLTAKCLLGMRWLVLAELERTAPEGEQKRPPAFTHAEPTLFTQPLPSKINKPEDLTSGQL